MGQAHPEFCGQRRDRIGNQRGCCRCGRSRRVRKPLRSVYGLGFNASAISEELASAIGGQHRRIQRLDQQEVWIVHGSIGRHHATAFQCAQQSRSLGLRPDCSGSRQAHRFSVRVVQGQHGATSNRRTPLPAATRFVVLIDNPSGSYIAEGFRSIGSVASKNYSGGGPIRFGDTSLVCIDAVVSPKRYRHRLDRSHRAHFTVNGSERPARTED